MSQSETSLTPHEARLVDLWERMVRTIGIHTVNVLVDRAIWEASHRHAELGLIEHNDNGLSFEALNKSIAGKPESETSEAFADLTTELLLILARLLGKEMAEFERHFRSTTAGKREGLGLGLYITRLIVEAHGGQVCADSEVGKGSTFYLALPLQ